MAVNKPRAIAVALLAACAAPWAAANDDVMRMLNRDVLVNFAKLGQTIEQCKQKEKQPGRPAVSADAVRALQLTRGQLLSAVFYLHQRNDYACTHTAVTELLYSTTLFERMEQEYKKTPTELPKALVDTIQPNPRYFELAVAYGQLNATAREQLEKMFGTEPFDLKAATAVVPEQ